MTKTILITGATDGIGLETAKTLASMGHTLLLHGRSPSKLDGVIGQLSKHPNTGVLHRHIADLAKPKEISAMVEAIREAHPSLDVLINNAGVLNTPHTTTAEGLDIRFAVNTLAPWAITQGLLPLMGPSGRVINLSSAAQSPVDIHALRGARTLPAMAAYAQSKLALTMWSCQLDRTLGGKAPVIVAVNPGSMLGTKMVKEGFGVPGGDISIGASILVKAALSEDFANAQGRYFDNDAQRFGQPHPDALDPQKCDALIHAIESMVAPWAS